MQTGRTKSASDILRQYRIYNPNLAIAPLEPGSDRHWRNAPIEQRYHRASEWQAEQWPDNANVAIATGSQNRLIVISLSTNNASSDFMNALAEHDSDLSPYAVRTPTGVQWYYRTRYDRTPAPTAQATIDDPGFQAIAEGQYVVAAGSLVNGTECKALLDQTLDIRKLPELPRFLADGLGFGEVVIPSIFQFRPRSF